MSEEVLQIAEKRIEAKSKGETERYNQLNAEFQRIMREKKAFLFLEFYICDLNILLLKTFLYLYLYFFFPHLPPTSFLLGLQLVIFINPYQLHHIFSILQYSPSISLNIYYLPVYSVTSLLLYLISY